MNNKIAVTVLVLTSLLCYNSTLVGQNAPVKIVTGIPVNYNEDSVGVYKLPDPLTMLNGKKVKNTKTWYKKRRPEIVKLFEEFQYGRVPEKPRDMSFFVHERGTPALQGKALRKQVTVYFTKDTSGHCSCRRASI